MGPPARPGPSTSTDPTTSPTAVDPVRAFLDDIHFATIATIDPDGTPRQAVIWYTLDGDELVLNSAVGRRWPSNLLRDPRVSISVTDHRDGYRWVGVTGRVVFIRNTGKLCFATLQEGVSLEDSGVRLQVMLSLAEVGESGGPDAS